MASEALDAESLLLRANWIWGKDETPDQYRCFRRSYHLEGARANSDGAFLAIAADTDFVAWLNGVEIGRGQFRDWPNPKTWTQFPVPPAIWRNGVDKAGENVLSIMVFFFGVDSFTYAAGPAGLVVALFDGTSALVSDADGQWRTARHSGYWSGRQERMTPQTGFTFEYDARKECSWRDADFDDRAADWHPACLAPKRLLTQRPLPVLDLGKLGEVSVKSQGVFLNPSEPRFGPADRMAARGLRPEFPWQIFANAKLAPQFAELDLGEAFEYAGRPADAGGFLNGRVAGETEPLVLKNTEYPPEVAGRYMILDLGNEVVGLLEFELEADDGVTLEIAHGEHLDDGRVRMKVGSRRFADRYVCKQGRNFFQMPFRRIGARYLEIHVSGFSEVRLLRMGLREVSYPIDPEKTGTFFVDDPLACRAWDSAVRTLGCCRHEHFEDSPWREQALYAYDGRLQALYGYHAFGDYKFAGASFRLIAQGFDWERGLFSLTSPGRSLINIPTFSLAWIDAIADHWLYSGDGGLYREFSDLVWRILEKAMARPDRRTGLYEEPVDAWNFYEWTPGLCGSMVESPGRHPRTFSAMYQLLLLNAMRSASWMADQAGDSAYASAFNENASVLACAAERVFHDKTSGWWYTRVASEDLRPVSSRNIHEFVQALASVEFGTPSVAGAGPIPCTLSSLFALTLAKMTRAPEDRRQICQRLESAWEKMLVAGATTFWETANGSRDFDFAGSVCHGWNALPAWFYQAYVLGIQPLKPGFQEFSIRIYPHRFASARGRIFTPGGFIEIEWRCCDAGLEVVLSCPETCFPRLQEFPEAPVAVATCNGQSLSRNRKTKAFLGFSRGRQMQS